MNRRDLLKFVPAGVLATIAPKLLAAAAEPKKQEFPLKPGYPAGPEDIREPKSGYLTMDQIAREALRILDKQVKRSHLRFHSVESDDGFSLNTVAPFVDGGHVAYAQQAGADILHVTPAEMRLPMEDFSARFIDPAARVIANTITEDLKTYKYSGVSWPLILPRGVHSAALATQKSGFSLRAISAYDIMEDSFLIRLDVLYGGI